MKLQYSGRTLAIAFTLVACCFATAQWEQLYLRWKYGPQVPNREVRERGINDSSFWLTIRGHDFATEDSRSVSEIAFWRPDGHSGPRPDTTLHGVWETGIKDRPYVVKVGKEMLFARPANGGRDLEANGDRSSY